MTTAQQTFLSLLQFINVWNICCFLHVWNWQITLKELDWFPLSGLGKLQPAFDDYKRSYISNIYYTMLIYLYLNLGRKA